MQEGTHTLFSQMSSPQHGRGKNPVMGVQSPWVAMQLWHLYSMIPPTRACSEQV